MRIGNYIVEECVGRGGMAVVWRVRQVDTDHTFALKALALPKASDAKVELNAELVATARLDHRNIVGVHDFGRIESDVNAAQFTPGAPYLVLEWMAGGTLRDHLAALDWSGALEVLRAVLRGLTHAHGQHILNRDLKPENVLCGSVPPDWRIADFGIALHGGAREGRRVARGTPPYMAPEQARGAPQDQGPWTDLYALGCMAWEMVTGAPPFVGSAREVLRQQIYATPPTFRPRFPVPDGLERWLRILLQKLPMRRPHFATDALLALDHVGEPERSVTWTAPLTTTAETWCTLAAVDLPDLDTEETHTQGPRVGFPHTPIERDYRSPTWVRGIDEALYRVSRSPEIGLLGTQSVLPTVAGRERCKTAMWSALVQARSACSPTMLVLTGASGMGRSRMAAWMAGRSHEFGQAYRLQVAGAEDTPQPLRRALEYQLGLGHLSHAVAALSLCEWLPTLSAEQAEAAVQALRGTQVGVAAALLPLVVHLARKRALVLLLDDILCDSEALDMVDAVLAAPGDHAIFILATVGDDQARRYPVQAARVKRWAQLDFTTEYRLGPMSVRAWRMMVMEQLDLGIADADAVGEAAGHNPSVGWQLLRALHEDGRLIRKRMSVKILGDVLLPRATLERIDGQVQALLDPLPASTQTAFVIAALMGRVVSVRRWKAVLARLGLRSHEATGVQAVQAGLVWQVDDRWQFVSDAVRRAIASRCTDPARLHLAIAEVSALDERVHPLIVGGHLCAAGEWQRAIEYLHLGIGRRLDTGDRQGLSKAADKLEQALLHVQAPEGDVRRARVLAARGAVASSLRDVEEMYRVHKAFTRAADTFGWRALEVGLMEQSGHALTWHQDMNTVVDYLAPSLDVAGVVNGFCVRTYYLLGRMAPGQGRNALALRAHTRAVHVADEHGTPWLRIMARYGRGIHLLECQQLDEGERWLDEAVAIAQQTDLWLPTLPTLLGHIWNARGEAARRRQRFDEAIEWYLQAWNSYRQNVDPAARVALINLCGALVQAGRNREARLSLDRRGADRWLMNAPILAQCRRVMLVAACAGQRDWDGLEAHLLVFERALETHPHMDAEYPLMLHVAADRAGRAGSLQREARLRAIAEDCERALAGANHQA